MANLPPDPVYSLRGSQYPISSIDFISHKSPIESIKYLASGTQEGLALIWDLKVRGIHLSWKAHDASILWVNFADFHNLWTCGRTDNAILWDIGEGSARQVKAFPLGEYLGFSRCDITKEQMLLAIPGPTQENVTLWDVKSAKKISCLTHPNLKTGSVMQCKWISYDSFLHILVAYENGTIAIWDWSNNKILSMISCNDNPLSLEFDSALLRGICGTTSEKVFVFTVDKSSHTLHSDCEFSVTNSGIGCICNRPDGKIYATGGWDYRVRLFTAKKHKPLAVLFYHKKSIECLAFSNGPVETFTQGYLLAAGSSDNSISLWDIYN